MSDVTGQVDALLSQVYELPAVIRAREFLSRSPITDLPYHNERHTLDVIRESLLFAITEGIEGDDLIVLAIAAAWHDVGFCISTVEHEAHSIRIFSEHRRKEQWVDVSADVETLIAQMIRDTKVHYMPQGSGSQQFAHTNLSRYLLDADLSNLGRADFFESFEALLRETGAPEYDFAVATLGLISRHRWNTSAAENLRLEQEMRNAQQLVYRIKTLQP